MNVVVLVICIALPAIVNSITFSEGIKVLSTNIENNPEDGDQFSEAFIGSSNAGLMFLDIIVNYLQNETSVQCRNDSQFAIDVNEAYTNAKNQQCKSSTDCECENNRNSVINENKWIKTLIDAYGKKGAYVQQGNAFWLGGYHECRSIHINDNSSSAKFNGKYCVLHKTTFNNHRTSQCDPTNNKTTTYIPLKFGVCVPDSCFDAIIDEQQFSVELLRGKIHVNFSLTCHQDLDISSDVRAISVISLCALIAFILIVSTVFDLFFYQVHVASKSVDIPDPKKAETNVYNNLSIVGKVLLAFSVVANAKKILNTQNAGGQLDCVHGIRFISMTWVILGHTYFFCGDVIDNLVFFKHKLFDIGEQTILNATFSVDTFFVLSGLLLAYLWMKETFKEKGENIKSPTHWLCYYVLRFIRLTPPYMIIMGMDIALFRYLADGPLWNQNGVEKNYCKTTWWTNLLYVNNFIYPDTMCMDWSWYLANDMQFHWISPLILIPLWFFPWVGIGLCGILIVASSAANGVISYQNNYPPNQVALSYSASQFNRFYGDPGVDVYMKPYTRAGPFFIGMILGYCLFKCRGRKIKLNKFVNAFCWIIAAALNLSVLYGLYNEATGGIMNSYVSAIYSGVGRSVWALGLSWVIFACITGNGGIVNKFLSAPVFVPLSRLTYCAYLVHPLVIMSAYYSRETAVHFDSNYTMVYFFFGHLFVAYSLAFMASIAFESPFVGLMKLFTTSIHNKDTASEKVPEENGKNIPPTFVVSNGIHVNGQDTNQLNGTVLSTSDQNEIRQLRRFV